jgi:hypothetical protein
MGVFETARALLLVKADASQAKAEARSLRGVEREAARERMAEMERTNSAMDKSIAMWGKVAAGVGLATAAVVVAKKAMNAFLEDTRLEAAATGANIDKLRAATRNLVEEDDLLAFAGKSMHGVWKLNQKEMETVLRGAMALQKTMGVELKPTIEALTESIAKGSTRALKEFGIEAKDKAEALKGLGDAWDSVGGKTDMVGDATRRAGVSLKDTFDKLEGNLGKLVIAMEPAIAAFAKLIALIPDSLAEIDRFTDRILGVDSTPGQTRAGGAKADVARLRAQAAAERRDMAALVKDPDLRGQAGELMAIAEAKARDLEKQAAAMEVYADAMGHKAAVAASKAFVTDFANMFFNGATPAAASAGKGRRTDTAGKPIGFSIGDPRNIDFGAIGAGITDVGRLGYGAWKSQGDAFIGTAAWERGEMAKIRAQAALDAQKAEGDRFRSGMDDASKVFGVPAEFDAHKEAVDSLAKGYGVLADAAGAAYEAMVTGSMSAGEAAKQMVAQGLMAIGKDFAVKALGETAMGVAALAIGGPFAGKSAADHFTAAGLFAGAAVAAGAGARALGVGSHGGASGGAGKAMDVGARKPGGGGDQQAGPINIYVGSEWANLSAVERASVLNRALRMGKRGPTSIRRE